MRLTDIMSGAGFAEFAQIALVLFFAVFCVIVIRIFAPKRRRELEAKKHLPFDDGEKTSRTPEERRDDPRA